MQRRLHGHAALFCTTPDVLQVVRKLGRIMPAQRAVSVDDGSCGNKPPSHRSANLPGLYSSVLTQDLSVWSTEIIERGAVERWP